MAGEDPEYTKWLRTIRCCAHECYRRQVQVHHITGAGMGLRSHDWEAMPLCPQHHDQLHRLNGMFSDWSREELRHWQRYQAARWRRIYLAFG